MHYYCESLFEVGQTGYGQGLFAAKTIRKGKTLGRVTGHVFCDPEYESNYCIDLGQGYSLEPREPFRLMNHSCDPNCELVMEEDSSRQPRLSIVLVETLRRIHCGEQITIDYGWPAEGAIPCACGSESCRGWIVDPIEADLIPPDFQARIL